MVPRKELFEGDEVAQRLAHLLPVDGNHVVVHPILCGTVPFGRGILRQFALVMGEHQVHSASVYVESLAEIFGAHGRALHMPAGKTVAPRRGPAHDMLRRSLFPEREIGRASLVALSVEVARPAKHVVEPTPGQDAVIVIPVVAFHVEIDRTVADVSITAVENALHIGYLFDDMTGGERFDGGRKHPERTHGIVVTLRIVVSYFHGFQLLEPRLLRYLVFPLVGIVLQMAHIGDVAHVAHLVTERTQVAEQQVESNGRPCVPQVRVAIDGRAADVDAHMGRIHRFELLLAPGEGIVEHQL